MAKMVPQFAVQDATLRAFNWRNLRRTDWLMVILVVVLAVVGWTNMFSASRTSEALYFQKHVLFFVAGLSIALVLICLDYRLLVSLAPAMYVVMVALLLAVEYAGDVRKGSGRWLDLGLFTVQPSELSKIIMVYSLTWYLNALGDRIRKIHWFLLAFILAAIPIAFILKQPNLGTAASLGPLVVVMLFAAGCRIRHLIVLILLGASLVPGLWWQMKDFELAQDAKTEAEMKAVPTAPWELKYYQKKRVHAYLNPGSDPRGSNWHTQQSMITVGSGGLTGKGFNNSTQTRLNYLPEYHTDFIFSLLAEERGFFGAAMTIGLFLAFLLRGLMFARDCPDISGTLLATGIVTILAFHIFVNIAITVGLMPVTGIPLPFLSYGGNFYLTTMACVGILLSVPMRRQFKLG